jgi:hypothetical protein
MAVREAGVDNGGRLAVFSIVDNMYIFPESNFEAINK